MSSIHTLKSLSGTSLFDVDDSGNVTAAGAITGTTVTASTGFAGRQLTDDLVKATVAVADATGGAADAALTLTLKQADGSTAITTARQVYLFCTATQYSPTIDTSPTFGSATVGSIIASGSGWALVKTSAAGAFACTLTNATDETLYVSASTPPAGVSLIADSTVVLGSNSDAVTWSA